MDEQVQADRLQEYIDQRRTAEKLPDALTHDGDEVMPIINMIHGALNEAAEEKFQDAIRSTEARQVMSVGFGAKRPRAEKQAPWKITFTEKDLERVQSPHTDALVVSLRVRDFVVRRIPIDPGSSADVMYYPLFKRLGLAPELLTEAEVPLVSFNSTPVWPLGHISMP